MTRRFAVIVWGLAALALAQPGAIRAADAPPAAVESATESLPADNPSAARQRWNSMSEKDREGLRENYRRWKGLSADQRKQLLERFRRFRTLSPDQRQRIVRNFSAFQRLSPEQKIRVRERFQRFQKLPPAERMRRLETLRKRRELIHSRPPGAAPAQPGSDQPRRRRAPRWRRNQGQ